MVKSSKKAAGPDKFLVVYAEDLGDGTFGNIKAEFTTKRRIDTLRWLLSKQDKAWVARFGWVIEAEIAALEGRGPKRKVDVALEYYYAEVARGREATKEMLHEAAETAGCQADTLKKALRRRD